MSAVYTVLAGLLTLTYDRALQPTAYPAEAWALDYDGSNFAGDDAESVGSTVLVSMVFVEATAAPDTFSFDNGLADVFAVGGSTPAASLTAAPYTAS